MAPPSLPAVKFLMRAMTMSDARALAAEALAMASAKEIYARCDATFAQSTRMTPSSAGGGHGALGLFAAREQRLEMRLDRLLGDRGDLDLDEPAFFRKLAARFP